MFSALVALFAIAGLAVATPTPIVGRQSNESTVQIVENCSVQGQVALTIDDGPYRYEYDVHNALDGAKATFFYNGDNWDCIYDRVDELRFLDSQGHTLASHTWTHPNMSTLNYDEMHDQLWKVEEAFIRILGKRPLYFRPPYGVYNDLVLQVLSERGYKKMFLWSDDTRDAEGISIGYQEAVLDRIADSYPEPHMILEHSFLRSTAGVLEYAVDRLRGEGYDLVTVDTCLGEDAEDPYEYVGELPEGPWTC